ncbi:MAG: FecR domain-containing protein [Deltaproteobacteria bacterium]|nr:FecR domain-containing protein [Deltaproteobacteria bacterium]
MNDLPLGCQRFMEILEQRLNEETPSAEDLAEAREHATECSECGALAGALRVMATPTPPSAAEHQAFKEAALWGEKIVRQRRGQRRAMWAMAAAVSGVVLGIVIWRFAHLPAQPTAQPQLALAQPWCGKTHLTVGEPLRSCGEARPLKLRDGSQMQLTAEGVATLLRADGAERRLRLEGGRLTVEVTPGTGRRFVVETAYCEAKVLGTVFEVRVVDGDAEVAVVEGTVEVAAKDSPPEKIKGGWQLRVRKRRKSALSARRSAQIMRALAPKPMAKDAETPTPAKDARVPDIKRTPLAQQVRAPALKLLLSRARSCRGARDLPCARKNYLLLQRHHRAAPVTITTLVALAEVELALRQPKASLKHSRRYLRLRPKGTLEREALHAELRALRALGRRAAEVRALKRFLKRFPSSIHASTLQARLKTLQR